MHPEEGKFLFVLFIFYFMDSFVPDLNKLHIKFLSFI